MKKEISKKAVFLIDSLVCNTIARIYCINRKDFNNISVAEYHKSYINLSKYIAKLENQVKEYKEAINKNN